MLRKLLRKTKLYFKRLRKGRIPARKLADGLTLGVFLGMTPSFGAQMPLAVVAAHGAKTDKFSALLGVWITNPITAPFIYWAEYKVGAKLLGIVPIGHEDFLTGSTLLDLGSDTLLSLLVGSIAIGIPVALTTWFSMHGLLYVLKWKKSLKCNKISGAFDD